MKSFFSFNKKAQGLSLNVIVIAVLALVVLVVMIIIFTSTTGTVSEDIQSCRGPVFKCVSQSADCEELKTFKCSTGEKCCHAAAAKDEK